MVRDLWEVEEESGENDALMVSLAELSKVSGVPVPVIVRLSREHPDRVPAVPMGSQQFYPRGVVAVVQELHAQERDLEGGRAGGYGIRSLARARREAEEARQRKQAEQEAEREAGADEAAQPAKESGEGSAEGEAGDAGDAEVVGGGGEASEGIAAATEGVARVDERTKELVAEIEEALAATRTTLTVEVRLLSEDWEA